MADRAKDAISISHEHKLYNWYIAIKNLLWTVYLVLKSVTLIN